MLTSCLKFSEMKDKIILKAKISHVKVSKCKNKYMGLFQTKKLLYRKKKINETKRQPSE